MVDQKLLSELAQKFFNNMPADLKTNIGLFKEDTEQTVKIMIEQTFKNLDLVTREQFDIQSKVLAKTRLQLNELQSKIQHLENLLTNK